MKQNSLVFNSKNRILLFSTNVIPCVFTLIGFYCLLFIDSGLTTDGYFHLISAELLQDSLEYTGVASFAWPPLYTLIVALGGALVELETSAKIISLTSGIGILVLIPRFVQLLGYDLWLAILLQLLIGLSPDYLSISLVADNHIFDAFLFLMASYFGIRYFYNEKSDFPWGFLLFTSLACLTKYPSWILVPSFSLTAWFNPGKNGIRRKHALIIIGLIILLTSPWFIYNYSVNGNIVSQFKGISAVGVGLEETGIRDSTQLKWIISDMFSYDGTIEFLQEHPEKYITHLAFNTGKVINLITYQFLPLGYFSVLIFLGLFLSLPRLSSGQWLFPFLSMLFFLTAMVFTRCVWEYVIHLGVLWSLFGAVLLWVNIRGRTFRLLGRDIFWSTCVIILLIGGLILKLPGDYKKFRRMINTEFHRWWTVSAYVRKNLNRLDQQTNRPASQIKIMGVYYYFPDIFHSGFRTVQAPFPEKSPEELFCYSQLSNRALGFFSRINYPSNLPAEKYVPPDFLLITPVFGTLLVEEATIDMSEYGPYLKSIPWWKGKPAELYKVNKSKIDCSE